MSVDAKVDPKVDESVVHWVVETEPLMVENLDEM